MGPDQSIQPVATGVEKERGLHSREGRAEDMWHDKRSWMDVLSGEDRHAESPTYSVTMQECLD